MNRLATTPTKAPKELDKQDVKKETEKLLTELDDLQNMLYAEGKHAILVVLQGMDASGKDGVIRKVFSRMNPQGVRVQSFKVPTEDEAKHDFLWRVHQHTPPKGMIQIFNRSHYEDVLVTRVHGLCDDDTAEKRFAAINAFEELLLLHNSTQVLKFYLHVSADEQEDRLRERVEDPTKQWKYNANKEKEAALRDKYLQMYEDVFENCSVLPWTIVPADQNWYKEYVVAKQLVETLHALKMKYPEVAAQPKAGL